jgi:hypothetical protein
VSQGSSAPLISVVLLSVASLAAAVLGGRNWIPFVFLTAVAFAVINPILCAFGPSWWRDTTFSALGFFGNFVMLGALVNAGIIPMRDDGMGMAGPVMIYLGAVPASGLLRLLLGMWRKA